MTRGFIKTNSIFDVMLCVSVIPMTNLNFIFNPLCANPTKWLNTFKYFADELFECV